MSRKDKLGRKIHLGTITIKGHILKPFFEGEGFGCELEDGEVIGAATLAELKTKLRETLEAAAKKERPNVSCFYMEYGNKLLPATYRGRHQNNRWSPWMFDIQTAKGVKRENLADSDLRRDVYKKTIDHNKLKALRDAVDRAENELNEFLEQNRFDPTETIA